MALRDAVLLDQSAQAAQHLLLLPAVDGVRIPRQEARQVGDRHAGVGVPVVNSHDAHGVPP